MTHVETTPTPGAAGDKMSQPVTNPSSAERIKENSNRLRGTIGEGLRDPVTGAVSADDTHVIKFHGIYQYDDRDLRQARQAGKLEPAYSFMIRTRIPGGHLNAAQWRMLDALSNEYGDRTMKITTRQTIQLHGVIKFKLKHVIREINRGMMDTISACGDVNRNVICSPDPSLSPVHEQVFPWAGKISRQLLPKTRAYYEIWLHHDGDRRRVGGGEDETLYGKHYLPRKFKIAIAIPPVNDTDVFTNDVGLIAIVDNKRLSGFNVAVGGGMGMTFGVRETYPRLAEVIGSCRPEQLLDVVRKIVTVQRDYGNRSDRRLARLKYTIDRLGLDWFRDELHRRLGFALAPAVEFHFDHTGDCYGWRRSSDGLRHLLLHVEHGRVRDTEQASMKTALQEIAEMNACDFRLTANQNLMLACINENNRPEIESVLQRCGVETDASRISELRKNSVACVALNTCEHAMAEAERYLPALMDKFEPVIRKNGLESEAIKIRMSGCPNGCARPYTGEIGLVGKSVGRYNLYLGASFNGDRLNRLYRENLTEARIIDELTLLFQDYAAHRERGEHFGDFVVRRGYVEPVLRGCDFHPAEN